MVTIGKAVYSHITKDPKVCGGKACIDGTRITVKDIVCLHEEGKAPEQMRDAFGSPLTLAQVHAALAYYYDHRDEIDASFADEDELSAEHERKRAEYQPSSCSSFTSRPTPTGPTSPSRR